jgi:5-(carboxyamino)imidazole ribonucleotide synthase
VKKQSIGVLGGGQLGKMLFEAGSSSNISYAFLEITTDCPAALVCRNQVTGSLQDESKIRELAAISQVLTYEIEHVNVAALVTLEKEGTPVFPKPTVLSIIQDKGIQKEFYNRNNIPTLPYVLSHTSDLKQALSVWRDDKFVLKHRKGGYDGKGVQLLDKAKFALLMENNDAALQSPDGYVIEQLAKDAVEVSVIIAIDQRGNSVSYAPCEMVFDPKSNLMDYLIAPSNLDPSVNANCEQIAMKAAKALQSPGLFAVELFVQSDGPIYVNEIAPRPHNSGHHTIESCYTSQYEQLNRILLNQPLGDTSLLCSAATCNIVGPEDVTGSYSLHNINKILKIQGVYIHMYGKKSTSPNRKLGHYTVLGDTNQEVREKMEQVKKLLSIKSD